MTIEVKQLIIKSTLNNGRTEQKISEHATVDIEQLKDWVMEECKEFIAEKISDLQER